MCIWPNKDVIILYPKREWIEKGIKVNENGNVAIDKAIADDTVVIAGLKNVYRSIGAKAIRIKMDCLVLFLCI